jgi:hypothetical protein
MTHRDQGVSSEDQRRLTSWLSTTTQDGQNASSRNERGSLQHWPNGHFRLTTLDRWALPLTGTGDSRSNGLRLRAEVEEGAGHPLHSCRSLGWLSKISVYSMSMPTDAEITYADHMGRFYARRYAFPPMVGRLLGYLAVCDPSEQTISELAEALLASRSAITGAVKALETLHVISRSRSAGERMDRVRIDMSSPESMGMDVSEYEELGQLAREGLQVLDEAPAERRAILVEMSAFADFLVEQVARFEQEWKARRAALVASGDLPEQPPQGRAQ